MSITDPTEQFVSLLMEHHDANFQEVVKILGDTSIVWEAYANGAVAQLADPFPIDVSGLLRCYLSQTLDSGSEVELLAKLERICDELRAREHERRVREDMREARCNLN